MTRGRIALLCAVAGLTVLGANALVDAIATGIYNCYPDPYFPEPCMAQGWANFGISVACWLVAIYLLARREAISLFACAFMGLMLWFSCARSMSAPVSAGRGPRRAQSEGTSF